MTVIRHNLSASNAIRHFSGTQKKQQQTLEKLSSGYMINRAGDDAAGLAISEKMRFYISGLDTGGKNISDGNSLCLTADGALEEVHSMLNRMYELTEEAANGICDERDRRLIDEEIQSLKAEIGRITKSTTFNGLPLFNTPYVFEVTGVPDDMEIFNATYDPLTQEASYGGIIFKGERFEWPAISPGMVDADGKFVKGTYPLDVPQGKLILTCENGTTPPHITRDFRITANSSGIEVDGETIDWRHVFSQDGYPIDPNNVEPSVYHFNYHGANVTFDGPYEGDTIEDVIIGIKNQFSDTVTWNNFYTHGVYTQAVDVTKIGTNGNHGIRLTNELAQLCAANGNQLPYHVRASEEGIWIEYKDGTAAGTKMSWDDLGIHSWDSGYGISDETTYVYKDELSGHNFEFEFTLHNETSLDSVIQGLDGMPLSAGQDLNDEMSMVPIVNDGNVISGEVTALSIPLTIKELVALGRDFGVSAEHLKDAAITFNPGTHQFSLSFKGTGGNTVLNFTSDSTLAEQTVRSYAANYASAVEARAKEMALGGPVITPLPSKECSVALNLMSSDGRNLSLAYKYDVSDIGSSGIEAEIVEDPDGDYMYNAATGKYVPYVDPGPDPDPSNPAPPIMRYKLDVTNTFSPAVYANTALTDLVGKSEISLDMTASSYLGPGNEIPNEVIESKLDSFYHQKEYGIWIQASNNQDDGMTIRIYKVSAYTLGISKINALSYEDTGKNMDSILKAINTVSQIRGSFGAYQNRLDVMENSNANSKEQLQSAESRIRDLDMAKELMSQVKETISLQASQAMMVQANQQPQSVLKLLQ